MKYLRQVDNYILFYEPLQRMYAVMNDLDISLWFDSREKDNLIHLPDNEFVEQCKEMLSF